MHILRSRVPRYTRSPLHYSPSASFLRFPQQRTYASENYFSANKPSVSDIERVLTNDEIFQRVTLNIRRSNVADSSVHALFLGAIDQASGENSSQAYDFLLHTWRSVFYPPNRSPNRALQALLYASHEKLVHVMMNRGDYPAFKELFVENQQLRSVHELLRREERESNEEVQSEESIQKEESIQSEESIQKEDVIQKETTNQQQIRSFPTQQTLNENWQSQPSQFPSWAYTVMDVLQLTQRNGQLMHNPESMDQFLHSRRFSKAQKHQLNAILLRKSLLYGSPSMHTIRSCLKYITVIDNNPQLSFSGHHLVYRPVLRLLFERQKGESDYLYELRKVVAEIAPESGFDRLLSAAMEASCRLHPDVVMSLFQFKQRQNTLISEDLTSVMKAHIAQNRPEAAIEKYAAYPALQDDEQIVLLLRVNERTKNWKLLQQQFEDMYGKRDLPRVIHYSVVMGALASMGSQNEVERLYEQMKKRQLQPNYPIFRAMIRSCINNNDYTQARVFYDDFMARVHRHEIDSKFIPRIEAEMLPITLFSSSVKSGMQAVDRLFEKQLQSSTTYLDSEMMVQMILFFSSTFSKKEFLRVWSFAEQAELLNERVFYHGARFYTTMGEFQKSNDLSLRAHQMSAVPFQSNLILKAQIKNYRMWIRQTADKRAQFELKAQTKSLVESLDERLEKKEANPRNLAPLLVEMIKYSLATQRHVADGQEKDAQRYFQHCKDLGLLTEEAYLPFLRESTGKDATFQDNSRVLDLYREMVASKIDISARSYKYLISALLKMDAQNQNGFNNSFVLLESIFEIYGFNLGASNFMASGRPKKHSDAELLRNAVPLLEIISSFSLATSGNIDLVVQFLNQFREQLKDKMTFGFRFSILKEMSKVYLSYGNLNVTASLVGNALGELNDIVDQFHTPENATGIQKEDVGTEIQTETESGEPHRFPDLQFLVQLPKLLQLQYREVYAVQLRMLDKKLQTQPFEPAEHELILRNCVRRNIRLSGDQFNEIFSTLLEGSKLNLPPQTLEVILNCCERFLVSGNWAEAMVFKKISHIYRVFLRFSQQTQPLSTIFDRYKILNEFYGIKTQSQLQQLLKGQKRNALSDLAHELRQFNAMHIERPWSTARFFNNIAEFFVPERLIHTRNFIRPGVAGQLVSHIETRSNGSSAYAFGLYDRYPETMEYLCFFTSERPKIVTFRKRIERASDISSAVSGSGRYARRRNSIRVLGHLGREFRGRYGRDE